MPWGSLNPWGSLRPWGSLSADVAPDPDPPATLRQAVCRLLETAPAVAAVVGDRIWPGALPESPEYPAVVYTVASGSEARHYRGSAGYASTRVQVAAWSDRSSTADRAAAACRARLVDFSGWVGSVEIDDCEFLNSFDLPERPQGGDEPCKYRVVLDLRVVHRI